MLAAGRDFVPLSLLRLQREVAPKDSYADPEQGMLARSIVEGKRRLDLVTLNELSGVSEANRTALPAVATGDDQYMIRRDRPLPLPNELSHRGLDGVHLWIGVQEGTAVVLHDADHDIFCELRNGMSPAEVVARLDPANPAEQRWDTVNQLIGRLAVAGFIRGIEGYTDSWDPAPSRFLRLHLTQRCNLTCIHCYADSSPYVSSEGELPVERWLKVIDDFADAGGERVLFTGGEALVYAGCPELLRRSRKRNLDVTLFTNGILIDRYVDVIRECVDHVQISIDGPDAETNDPIRGQGSFLRAKKAVDVLLNAGVRVRISMVLMERNIQELQSGFLAFARQWEGKPIEWRLGYGVTSHGRGTELQDHLTVQQARPIVEGLMEELEGKFPRIARSTKTCGYAEQVVIAPDGGVHPCHLLDGAITHIDRQSMSELMGILKKNSLEYNVDHTVGCNRCDIRNLCGGSCRVNNGKYSGNRRVTNCEASEKLSRLHNLIQTFSENPVPERGVDLDWE